jgi:hypothetical protein
MNTEGHSVCRRHTEPIALKNNCESGWLKRKQRSGITSKVPKAWLEKT